MAKITLLAGAAAGAGILYYLFDPKEGAARRKRLADQSQAAARDAIAATNARLDHTRDALMGAAADALPDDKPESDQALIAKVRSEALGSRFSAVSVDASDGVVTLRGVLDDAGDISDLEDAVSGVTGVEEVENLVHLPGQVPDNVRASRRAPTTR